MTEMAGIEHIYLEADRAYAERMSRVAEGIVDALSPGLDESGRSKCIEDVLVALRPLDERFLDFDKNAVDKRRF